MREQTRAYVLAGALAACALPLGAPATARAQVSADAAAQVRFARGREAFLARNFEQALEDFRAANQLVPSPNTRLYIARCLRELGRLAESYVEFQRAAAEAADRTRTEPRYAATRDAARGEGSALEPRIGRLTVRVPAPPPGITVSVAGADLPSAGWGVPTPIDPGDVAIVASAPGRLPLRRTVRVAAGASEEATVELAVDPSARAAAPPQGPDSGGGAGAGAGAVEGGGGSGGGTGASDPAAPTSPTDRAEGGGVRVAGVVVASVGLAGMISFGIFGSLAHSRYNDLRLLCGSLACDPSLESQIAEGEGYQLMANLSVLVGVTGLLAGTVMIALGGPTAGETRPRPSAARTRPGRGPALTPVVGFGQLGVRGAF